MPIEPAYEYNTFNTMGAENGSGVEIGVDTWEDFRKKTNGLYNRLSGFGVAPKARGLITWTPSSKLGSFGNPSFSIKNDSNVSSFSWSNKTGFTINFETPAKNTLLLPFGDLAKKDGTMSIAPVARTTRKPDSNVDDRHSGDIGTVVFHSPTKNSISVFPYVGLLQDNRTTGYNERAVGGLFYYSSLSFVIFSEL